MIYIQLNKQNQKTNAISGRKQTILIIILYLEVGETKSNHITKIIQHGNTSSFGFT